MHSMRYRLSVRCHRDPDRELHAAGPAPDCELHTAGPAPDRELHAAGPAPSCREREQTRGRSRQSCSRRKALAPPRRPVPSRAPDKRHGSEAPRAKPTAFISACRNPNRSLGRDLSAFKLKLAMGRNQALSQHEGKIVTGLQRKPSGRA